MFKSLLRSRTGSKQEGPRLAKEIISFRYVMLHLGAQKATRATDAIGRDRKNHAFNVTHLLLNSCTAKSKNYTMGPWNMRCNASP